MPYAQYSSPPATHAEMLYKPNVYANNLAYTHITSMQKVLYPCKTPCIKQQHHGSLQMMLMRPLDMLVNIPPTHALAPTDNGLVADAEELVNVGAALEARVAGADLLAAVGEVGAGGGALLLPGGFGGILLGGDLVGSFDPLEGEAAAGRDVSLMDCRKGGVGRRDLPDVPDDVAVHQPCTWVVGLETWWIC